MKTLTAGPGLVSTLPSPATQDAKRRRIMAMTTIYLVPSQAALSCAEGARTVTADFRKPSRSASINISSYAWDNAASQVPEKYRAVITAALDTAARNILNRELKRFSVWPSEIDDGYFAEAALIDTIINAGTEWLTKEELEAAWNASATRAKWITRADYGTNKALRAAVAHYEGLILKIAGKTSTYTPADLDLILAKMEISDLDTQLGSFICRRVEALKNKPEPVEVANTDLL